MTVTVIELNDSEIRVAKGTEIVLRSPGYAVAQKEGLELGEAAVRLARLNPRATYNRYWSSLNQDPLQYPSTRIRHNADLAYAHLLAIYEQAGKPEQALFAVPGYYSNEQLALLLGLIEASPITAIGLVDSAVAAAAPFAGSGEYVHVEIHLHQAVLTRMHVSGYVDRRSVQIIDGVGLLMIHDACAALISDLFIKQSRFDPQHHAETEQALYNQIPACLASLQTRPEVSMEIPYQTALHQAKLPRAPLLETLQPLYEKIINSIPAAGTCLLGDRLAGLPGFAGQLSAMEILKADSVFQGCQQQVAHILSSGPTLNFVTRLPATSTPVISASDHGTPPAQPDATTNYPITHILNRHHAYPLGPGRLYLSAVGGSDTSRNESSHCSVLLNGEHAVLQSESEVTVYINGQQLNAPTTVSRGDIITFADSNTEYVFISVLN